MSRGIRGAYGPLHVYRPRVGERIRTGLGTVTVTEVRENGLELRIRDRIGRAHTVRRSEAGVWCRPLGPSCANCDTEGNDMRYRRHAPGEACCNPPAPRVLGSSAAYAVGRFKPDGPDGYRAATAPNAPLRATRAEAEFDQLAFLDGATA